LEFDEPTVNDVVYVEGAVGNIYLETAADLVRYRRIFSRGVIHSPYSGKPAG
jgi:hypothetical protein